MAKERLSIRYRSLPVMKSLILTLFSLLSLAAIAPNRPTAPRRPNILWITVEDMSPHLGSYGDRQVQTPNLDRLASEGIRYTNAFTTAGVCAPSRAAIITGMYQQSIGAQHMRTLGVSTVASDAYPPGFRPYSAVVPEPVRCFSEYLRAAGYYCTNNVKQDYQFEAPPTAWDASSGKAHWRSRPKSDSPFFAIFNFTTTHESQVWARSKEPLLVRPEDVVVPPYYPDVPAVRQDIARHLTNVMVMDRQAGDILQQLKEDGLDDDTIVFFFSDHGDGLPFVKREIYDRGLRVPFLVRFPKNFPELNPYRQAGQTDSQLISFVDLAPTMLSLAGVPIPSHLQGQAFLGPQRAKQPRRYAFAARDRMDSEYDRVRAVHDGRYQYLRNCMPEKPYYQPIRYRLQQPMMQVILALKDSAKLNEQAMHWFRTTKPAEELYDVQTDPHQFRNLADDPRYQNKLQELKKVYDDWLNRVGDMSGEPEMQMVSRWWQGHDKPPATATPQIRSDGKKWVVVCPTKGASVGYKRRWSEPAWQVYTGPLSQQSGDSLYVVAQRIGFTRSEVAAVGR